MPSPFLRGKGDRLRWMRDVASLLAFLRLKQGQYPLISSLARRHGRRFAALAALPVAPAAPLPKKFFDTFWEPCIRAPASPSGGSHVQKHVLTEFYTPPPTPLIRRLCRHLPPRGEGKGWKEERGALSFQNKKIQHRTPRGQNSEASRKTAQKIPSPKMP